MTAATPPRASKEIVSEVQLTRRRLAQAEAAVETAQIQARLAKRRRKEAKLAARRAKKLLKRAKADLAETQRAMAESEARMVELRRKRPAGGRRKAKLATPRPQAERKSKPVATAAAGPCLSSDGLSNPKSVEISADVQMPREDPTNRNKSA